MKQTLKYIYDKLLELTKIAEAKYSITLALASGVIVLGSSFIGQSDIYVKILSSGTVVFALISIIYGFVALFSRHTKIRIKRTPKNVENLMFYRTIICFNEHNFLEEIKKQYNMPKALEFDQFDIDLSRSVIAQARAVYIKFIYFNFSVVFLMLAVFMAVAMAIVLGGI